MKTDLLLVSLTLLLISLARGSILEDLLEIQDAAPDASLDDEADGEEFAELDKLTTLNQNQIWRGPEFDRPYALLSNEQFVYNTKFNSTSETDASPRAYKLVGKVMAIVAAGQMKSKAFGKFSFVFTRIQEAVLMEYRQSRGAFVYDDDFDEWRFCSWINITHVIDETGHLRLCFPYELLNLGPFPRKPAMNKDVIEGKTVSRLYQMAMKMKQAEPILEDWLSSQVSRSYYLNHSSLRRSSRSESLTDAYWRSCSTLSSDGSLHVNLWAFASSDYFRTCT